MAADTNRYLTDAHGLPVFNALRQLETALRDYGGACGPAEARKLAGWLSGRMHDQEREFARAMALRASEPPPEPTSPRLR